MLIGAFLIVLPVATSLPSKSDASGSMMTAFRPQMTDAALAQGRADQQTMAAMGDQLNNAMIPALAAQMQMTPQQLSSYLAANFPATGKGMAALPSMLPFFTNLQDTMQAQQANFQQADQIPTGFLPPTTMTVLFVIPGVLLVLTGLLGLYRPARVRSALAAASVVALLTVVGLLSVSMSSKASAADEMTTAFQPVFAAQNVQQARAYTDTAQAMSTEFTTATLPGLATALHVTPAQLSATMAQNFPAVATGVAQLPQIVQRMQTATGLIEANAGNYAQTASIPWSPGSMVTMFWLMMAPALLALGVGVGALAASSRRPTVLQPASTMRGALHH
ncbi:MAG TPA: hypothetical protein VN193_12070 [Candidatus Angelobacter sp.]|nr:hypothetical protein [Candidatus Angelobacter sp.]